MCISKYKANRGYWKLNKTLLRNETFKMKAIEIIDRYWIMNTFGKYWELTKYEVRNLAISMGKSLLLLNDRRNVELQNKLWSCLVKKNYFPRIIKFVIITNRIRHSL